MQVCKCASLSEPLKEDLVIENSCYLKCLMVDFSTSEKYLTVAQLLLAQNWQILILFLEKIRGIIILGSKPIKKI